MYYVADAHGIIWYLTEDKKLGEKASSIFNRADNGEEIIIIPTIVLAEIMHICDKRKLKVKVKDILEKIKGSLNYIAYSLDLDVLEEAEKIKEISEMHDKIIVATCILTGALLITKDKEIINSKIIQTVW